MKDPANVLYMTILLTSLADRRLHDTTKTKTCKENVFSYQPIALISLYASEVRMRTFSRHGGVFAYDRIQSDLNGDPKTSIITSRTAFH